MTEVTKGKELTVQERASRALGLANLEADLKKLAEGSQSITQITNQDGYQQCHSKRMALKNQRVAIEKAGKAARDDANAFAKAVIAEEKRLVGIISPEEVRLQRLQQDHDEKAERERQAKIEAEQRRVEAIQERIADIRSPIELGGVTFDTPAERLATYIKDTDAIAIDESFDEFQQQARDAKDATLSRLRQLHKAAEDREVEAARIAEERAELERLRAEQAKREETERKEREAKEAAERKKREAEDAKRRAELEAQRKKQAEERARIDAENKRIADERAAFEREQEAAREREAEAKRQKEAEERAAAEAKAKAEAAARKAKFPGEAAIIDALVQHFDITEKVARAWLSEYSHARSAA